MSIIASDGRTIGRHDGDVLWTGSTNVLALEDVRGNGEGKKKVKEHPAFVAKALPRRMHVAITHDCSFSASG